MITKDSSSMAGPRQTLSVVDGVAMIVGIVVGAGIFRSPSIVAASAGSKAAFLLVWPLGGAISLVGALCYAELASAYPDAGGDYRYFTLSYGRWVAFLFAWARLMVIQTGSIVLLAFVFGDYSAQLIPLGSYGSAIYAVVLIVLLTFLNALSVKQSARTQKLLSAAKILGLLSLIVVGLLLAGKPSNTTTGPSVNSSSLGLAMVFVLLTYGGWNEIAFAAAEFRNVQRDMLRALLWGILIITAVFVLVNFAYLEGLGFTGIAGSEVVAADLMRRTLGESGARFIGLLIAVSTIGAANVTIFTGARTNYALGKSFAPLGFMGKWSRKTNSPVAALLAQGAISLALVFFGAWRRRGFGTLVEYTAPVFWLFFLLAGVSLLILRRQDPATTRPFKVPLYPWTPLIFCAACAYMLWSSVAYTGVGALVGIAVLVAGLFVFLIWRGFGKNLVQSD